MDTIKFEDNLDHFYITSWNCLAHDAESNRFRQSSIEQKVAVVESARSRVPGGEWPLVRALLLSHYGPSKRTTIGRWMAAAQGLHADVRVMLRGHPDMPQSYVWDLDRSGVFCGGWMCDCCDGYCQPSVCNDVSNC